MIIAIIAPDTFIAATAFHREAQRSELPLPDRSPDF
jgi:hypothetical protein